MELSPELNNRLAELRGELLWGRLSGTAPEAGWLACELIEAGLNSPAVWELAGYALSIGSMTEVEPLVREVMVEAGFPPIDLQRTPWAVARDVAQGIAEGTLPIGSGADFLISELGVREEFDGPNEIDWLMILIDDWEAVRKTPPSDDELREQARKIADVATGRLVAMRDQEA
ncbi:hypothetical protein JOL79_03790 [Microbispora sp. RL4-1S]|uniref:Uncharacterized protein n=1 Tax=Microbispora oryzae TaxID=2806554 RepID=A0A940WE33_9ACTN|nr:hypothetical protein [Microbispora oryzae]MBP2702923.1 hypothetical protein [Microbispora oryzae]